MMHAMIELRAGRASVRRKFITQGFFHSFLQYDPAEMDYFGNYMSFVNGSLADNLDSLPDPVDKSV